MSMDFRILFAILLGFYYLLFKFTNDHLISVLIEVALLISFILLTRDWNSKLFPRKVEALAMKENRVMSILYEDAKGRQTKREIEIYPSNNKRYILAFCRLVNEPRTFRRDRILMWEVLEKRFTYNPHVAEWFATEGKDPKSRKTTWMSWKKQHERVYANSHG